MKPTAPPIMLTPHQFATEVGLHVDTMTKRLRAAGQDIRERGAKYPLGVLARAWSGDLAQARARESSARADLLELERRQTSGELVEMSEARALLTKWLQPIAQHLTAMPATVCSQANPTDPQHALGALQRWADDALRLCREVTEDKT